MKDDLAFISGSFVDYDVPVDKRFLLKYFKTNLQMAFLRYFLVFGHWRNFTDHTGYYCNKRQVYRMGHKLLGLIKLHEQAKSSLSEEGMELLQNIESGKFRLTRMNIS